MSDFAGLKKRALEIRDKYDELNRNDGRDIWRGVDYVAGFVGDVGDLTKLIMAKEGKRRVPENIDAKLQHELGDCLWSLLIISDQYGINLEQAFLATMDELQQRFVA